MQSAIVFSLIAMVSVLAAAQESQVAGQEVVTREGYTPTTVDPKVLCDACNSCDIPSTARSLLVIADFQAGPVEPCPTGTASVAAIQQWAMFDLLDMVQKDVRFGSVFVTDRPHVFRRMDVVLPTDRADIRRKLMLARPKNGGSISEGLSKGIELLEAIPIVAGQDRKLSLVLLLSRYPADDIEAIKRNINLIHATEVHLLATAPTATADTQLSELAGVLNATFGTAHLDRELPNAMLHVYRQLNVFDQSYIEELNAIRAAIDKCCKEKSAICKLLDKTEAPACNYTEILTLIRDESKRIENRLILIENILSKPHPVVDIDLGPLKDLLVKLINELEERIKLSLTEINENLTYIKKKIDTIDSRTVEIYDIDKSIDTKIDKIVVTNVEGLASLVVSRLAGWFWTFLLLLLIAIGGILFVAIVSRKIHKHVHHSKGNGKRGTELEYGGSPSPTKPQAY